uniref:Uncharacterized protein n=1 Tax=viral metagenome TaxID=1070528 RepID=A0A6C0FA96_9ZZZZ|tara:strand:- start:22658 stop:24094 length:1437 start_codon:yes stop_codon:yes gene_type:complete
MDIIDIGENDMEPVSIKINDQTNSSTPSVNFGDGIELLMNDKKKTSDSANVDLGDLDDLESELNNLSQKTSRTGEDGTKTLGGMASELFGMGGFTKLDETPAETINIDIQESDSNLGNATRESVGSTKTWDGFAKMNEVPSVNYTSNMTELEKRRKKRMMLKKMDEWYEKGHTKQSSSLNIDSPFEEIEDEYETIMDDKRKKDSIKLQQWWFMTFVNSVEYANAVFNPFDLNLDGWGEQISEDIDSYDEIFEELHEKYKGGKMAPELSLLLRLGFSAAVLNFSNKALSSATPAFNDVIRQNPELMKAFTEATVNNMSQQSPGFEFANNMMKEQENKPRGPPPPAPIRTKEQPPPSRPGMTYTDAPGNRPDIAASRGAMFQEKGVEMNRGMADANEIPQVKKRPEMRGPQNSDVDDILAGLKTRTVDIRKEAEEATGNANGNESVISVSSLKDLQNTSIPQKSNRKKNNSAKNTISLDI